MENYDTLDAAYDWARQTLNDHRNDKREHVYTRRAAAAAAACALPLLWLLCGAQAVALCKIPPQG